MIRHITLPKGFLAAGVACGVKPSGKPDLAIFASETDASVAMLTTSNQIVGAPVLYLRETFPKGTGVARGMVVNSGCSNVCTGKTGLKNARAMAARTAQHLGCASDAVLVASTGVIGQPLPMAKIRTGIDQAAAALSIRNDSAALQAIMTTDTREKSAVVQCTLGGTPVTLAGVVKGSGMIAPSLATMIAVLTTDAAISPSLLGKALRTAAGTTFNAVTVDSDQSTSDTVVMLANGQSGANRIRAGSVEFRRFQAALEEVCSELARAIVVDGEGATRLVEITVRGARSDKEAAQAAKSVADSPLVKTAIHGSDPNWGRIAMALGKSTATVRAETLTIKIAGATVFSRGIGRAFDASAVSAKMSEPTVPIECNLGLGKGSYTALTCDLSKDYITINAEYTT
jgi:glutamate N-acetyltransferase/amino-acid N-acetyltransferase